MGFVPEALQYCDAVLAGIGALPKCPPNLALARAVAADLRERLQQHSKVGWRASSLVGGYNRSVSSSRI